MSEDLRKKVECINARVSGLVNETRSSLRGESNFGMDEILRIREPLDQMSEIMRQTAAVRTMMPEISGQLDEYKSQLGELQGILDKVRVMLLARQASLMAGRAQIDAAAQWMNAFQETR